ncbi:MAG: SAM-dependent methyltransferase [Nocardioides sp.]
MPLGSRQYALLVHPSANRVYALASEALTVAELGVLAGTRLEGRIGEATPIRIAGVPYLAFDGEPTPADLALLGDVSTAMALFQRDGDALTPVELPRRDQFDDDLLTILKYAGKTNELFTKLLLNITVWSGVPVERPLHVLDPMCGRGTTLNQVLMNGWHAAGIDVDDKDFDAYAAFLRQWLKLKRLKHTADTVPLRREGSRLGRRFQVEIGVSKEEWTAGRAITLDYANTDTLNARSVHRATSFDAVVADAPYGVQHGSRSGGRLERNPLDLLRDAVPIWAELLRPGGALGIAWNTHVAGRDDALAALTAAGLDVLDDGPYRALEHRVDQAIQRDVLVARKPV